MPGDSIVERRMNKKDMLIAYLNSKDVVPEMEAMWERYEYIENLTRSMNRKNAALVIGKKYDLQKSQVYKLIREVEEFSGAAHAPNREYLRWVQIERLRAAQEIALATNNLMAFDRISNTIFKWVSEYGDIDQGLLDKLEPRTFNMQININNQEVNLDLEKFYKLQSTQMKELTTESANEIAPWEAIKKMLDEK